MTQKVWFRVVCVMAVLFLLAACGGGPSLKDQLVGKWSGDFDGTAIVMEFTKDGAMSMSGDVAGTAVKVDGTYTWSDAKTIDINLTSGGAEAITGKLTVVINGDKLTLTDDSDSVQELTRVKE